MRRLLAILEWFAAQRPAVNRSADANVVSSNPDDGETKPFMEHMEDLRRTLIRVAVALFVGFNICLLFANRILFFLEAPLIRIIPNPETCLQSLNVTDSFVLAMKLSFYGGLLLTLPLVIYFIADFILPALKPGERSSVIQAFLAGTLLFVAGVAACYYAMIPQTLKAFIKYSEWLGIKPQWTVSSYVGFVTQFMLAVGATFEVPLVILLLVRLGIISAGGVARSRRIMMGLAVLLAAVLAPPDPLSMIVMALPLAAMFEVTIWLAKLVERRSLKRRNGTA